MKTAGDVVVQVFFSTLASLGTSQCGRSKQLIEIEGTVLHIVGNRTLDEPGGTRMEECGSTVI